MNWSWLPATLSCPNFVKGRKVLVGKSVMWLAAMLRVSKRVMLWKTLLDIMEIRLSEMSRNVSPVTSSKLESSNSVSKLPDMSRVWRLKRYFMAAPGTLVK